MCGIVGYVGAQQAAPILLEGLQKLEYRGYDSAGIAVLDGSTIELAKACGEIKNLLAKTHDGSDLHGYIGLGHTRWATHGAPTEANAHPHVSNDGKFAIVQNGIIENFMELREMLQAKGSGSIVRRTRRSSFTCWICIIPATAISRTLCSKRSAVWRAAMRSAFCAPTARSRCSSRATAVR